MLTAFASDNNISVSFETSTDRDGVKVNAKQWAQWPGRPEGVRKCSPFGSIDGQVFANQAAAEAATKAWGLTT